MKCIHCGKKIQYNEGRELLGLDGDFIHTKCLPDFNDIMDRINSMDDPSFESWIREEM